MKPDQPESAELERRMQIAMQKAGFIIPSDLNVDENPPSEAMEAEIPESLSNIDAAMAIILGANEECFCKSKVIGFSNECETEPFAIAARNGEMKLSGETLEKLNREGD